MNAQSLGLAVEGDLHRIAAACRTGALARSVEAMATWRGKPSDKQLARLTRIFEDLP